MKVVKPITVNDDAILTASTIAEPDLLSGEAAWEDRSTELMPGGYNGD